MIDVEGGLRLALLAAADYRKGFGFCAQALSALGAVLLLDQSLWGLETLENCDGPLL
jgi:hypothetical protein